MTESAAGNFEPAATGPRRTAWKGSAVALCVTLLAACGGGGSDGDDDSPQMGTPESNVPLAIVQGNEKSAVQVPAIYGESLLALALDLDLWTRAFAASPRPTLTQGCALGGTLAWTWTDSDGNGQVNSGDTLRLDLLGCVAPASMVQLSGSAQLTLLPSAAPGAVALRVRIASDGLRFPADSLTAAWKGGFDSRRELTPRRDHLGLEVVGGDALRVEFTGPGISASDRIQSASLSREADADFHGAHTSLALTLASDVLRGRVELSTPVPMFAHFDVYPLRGAIESRGIGRVRLQAGSGTLSAWLTVLEGPAAGSGTTVFWSEFFSGLVWMGPGELPAQYAAVRELSAVPFSFAQPGPDLSIDASLRQAAWQLNRELLPSAAPTAARLTRVGPGWGPATIDASVIVRGGNLRLGWVDQLEPGATYTVGWLVGSPPTPVGQLVSNDLTFLPISPPATLAVADALQARIATPASQFLLPTAAVRLDGSASSAGASGIASYRWSQRSGTPVTLTTPDQPVTDVTIPASAGAPTSDVVLELQVADDRGVVDIQSVTLLGVPSPATSQMARMRGAPGDPLLNGAEVFAASSFYGDARWKSGNPTDWLRIPVSFGDASPAGYTIFFFSLPLGTPLQPGVYTAPVSLPFRVDTAAMDIWATTQCQQPNGSFTIHEVQLAPPDGSIDGTPIAKLALDFSVSCAGAPSVQGSLRLGSAWPMP